MSENNEKRTQSTILVSHAAHELGLAQEQFRQFLKPFYKNWETVKRIKYQYYTGIAEAMLERAQEVEEQSDNDSSDQVADNSFVLQTTEQPEINSVPPSSLALPDKGGEVEPQENKEVEEKEDTHSLALPDESEGAGEIEASPEEIKAQLQMQLTSHLPQQAIKLNSVIKVLALSVAEESVRDFEQIYTHRVNTGINRVISNQTAKTCKAIDELQKADNSDFLGDLGKLQSLELRDLDAGMEILLNKIK